MSSIKIDLEYPYSSKWRFGYIVTNPEGRETLLLFNSKNDRTSTQYARYLLSVSLGRFLVEGETVDHIDGDKTNNNLENLQILSMRDNLRKANKKPDVELVCPICKTIFYRSLTQLRGRKVKFKLNLVTCSRSCGGKLSHVTKNFNLN